MPDLSIAGLDDWGLWVAGVTAGLTALVVIARGVRWVWRSVRGLIRWGRKVAIEIAELHELAQYELRPNGGGSLVDHAGQVPALVYQVGDLSQQVARQRDTLEAHLTAATAEQRQMWAAIEAVAKAQPPEV